MPDLMPNEMTAAEAAEKLEYVYKSCSEKYSQRAPDAQRDTDFEYYLQSIRCAASYLRAIAAGEYKRVVHGRWIRINNTQEQWLKSWKNPLGKQSI